MKLEPNDVGRSGPPFLAQRGSWVSFSGLVRFLDRGTLDCWRRSLALALPRALLGTTDTCNTIIDLPLPAPGAKAPKGAESIAVAKHD